MKNIPPILQQLASKLNTTVSYLWNIELHHAFLNGIYNIIIFIITILIGIVLYKVHNRLSIKDKYENDYYANHDWAGIIMTILFTIYIIFFIACMFYIPDTMNSFLDPEYWALKDILSNIKQ